MLNSRRTEPRGSLHTDLLDTIRAMHAGKKRVSLEVPAELSAYAGEVTIFLYEFSDRFRDRSRQPVKRIVGVPHRLARWLCPIAN
jgi:hypothetical protein